MAEKKTPNPIDIHVGSRVRLRRMMLGMSQEKLGEQLLKWPMPGASRGQLEFFIEQLVEQPR